MDNQSIVVLLLRRKCDFDEVWVRIRVLWDEVLYFLYESFSTVSYEE